MSRRPAALARHQAAQLGGVVEDLRARRWSWKEIEDFLGYSSKQLRRYVRLHGMSHQEPLMSHRKGCAPRDAA